MANASGTAAVKLDPRKGRLNADIRAQLAQIDNATGPLRLRVTQAVEKIIHIIMPRDTGAATRGHGGRNHEELKSSLVRFAVGARAPQFTVRDAQAAVLGEFARKLLETDFRRKMAKDGARPFSYLVRCVRNRAIEMWRLERGIGLRHERAAGDAALAPEAAVNPIDEALGESEELAVALAELGRLPIALSSLDREDLLLLFLSAVLRLHRDRIGDVLGTTANTAGQRLRRLRDRLHALLHDGRARAPAPGRARGGKASARKRAASRNGHDALVDSAAEDDVRHNPDALPFSGEDPQPVEGGDEES